MVVALNIKYKYFLKANPNQYLWAQILKKPFLPIQNQINDYRFKYENNNISLEHNQINAYWIRREQPFFTSPQAK